MTPSRLRRSTLRDCGLITLFVSIGSACNADALSLSLGNRSPYISQFVTPVVMTDTLEISSTEFRFSADISSHSLQQQRAGTMLELDGESWRTSIDVRRKINRDWILGIEVPVWHHSGGVLDSAIDRWHAITGLADGERPQQPQDTLNFLYANALSNSQFTNTQTALGDIQLTAARRLSRQTGSSNWLQFTAKLPTGDAQKFSGSGAADAAIQFNHHRRASWRAKPIDWLITATAMHTGRSDHVIDNQRRQQYRFSAQWSWAWRDSVRPQIQVRWRSAPYDSVIPALGKSSVGLDTGIQLQQTSGRWQLGISEDIKVDSAPDITIYAQYSRH